MMNQTNLMISNLFFLMQYIRFERLALNSGACLDASDLAGV